jgi:uncharacterized protein YodC (DUF2158 family)
MSSGPLSRRGFKPSRLKLVAASEEFRDDREPPFRLGDVVRLNSGGPNCLVVDLPDFKTVTVSWCDEQEIAREDTLPIECVHRVRLVG